ncbi:MAG: hypothetical protein GY854_24220 [Deltaproteobacteria bacterium]|nr:hypothetical protein [Deltaproteobacteria bacterium]
MFLAFRRTSKELSGKLAAILAKGTSFQPLPTAVETGEIGLPLQRRVIRHPREIAPHDGSAMGIVRDSPGCVNGASSGNTASGAVGAASSSHRGREMGCWERPEVNEVGDFCGGGHSSARGSAAALVLRSLMPASRRASPAVAGRFGGSPR